MRVAPTAARAARHAGPGPPRTPHRLAGWLAVLGLLATVPGSGPATARADPAVATRTAPGAAAASVLRGGENATDGEPGRAADGRGEPAGPGHAPDRRPAGEAYRRPVPGEVVQGFALAEGPYGPGHRGIDLDARAGDPVRAAARGVVAHAGPVAGRGWVSIDHPDGVRTSYGPLTDLRVGAGEAVVAGQRLGRLDGAGHGDGDDGLHLGARRDGAYLDPRLLLAEVGRPTLVGPGRVRPGAGAAGATR